jgi:mono/diheme cytochrome c family protein
MPAGGRFLAFPLSLLEDPLRLVAMTILGAALLAAGPAAAADSALANRGLALAKSYCSGCHRVSGDQAIPPPVTVETETGNTDVKAPSFWLAAHQEGRDDAYFRKYMHAPRDPMPEEPLEPGELDAIVAYLMSLRAQPAGTGW